VGVNTERFAEAMGELADSYVREAILYDKRCMPKRHHTLQRAVILAAAAAAILTLCGFAAYELGLFDPWLQEPSTDPVRTVRSAIEHQMDKGYAIRVYVEEIKIDDAETDRVRARYSGSELAQARGWTDAYLAEHFVVVRAKYDVEYDHTKTFMDDGYTEQDFYVTQDLQTGQWTIVDNTSPNTSNPDIGPPVLEAEGK